MRDWIEAEKDRTGPPAVLVDVLLSAKAMRLSDPDIEGGLDSTCGAEDLYREVWDRLLLEFHRRKGLRT